MSMISVEDSQGATQARERGNEFYRKGQLGKAIKAYEEAAKLAPSDSSPLSNLSAAKFEAGNYVECIDVASKALSLLDDGSGNQMLRQRLLTRSARACLISSRLNQADEFLANIDESKDREELGDALRGSREFSAFAPDPSILRKRLLQLPRLRPSMQDEPDYFGPGNDEAEPQYTTALGRSAHEDPVLGIMFCGIGDARHLFQTLLRFTSAKNESRSLHLTMLDHKPAVLARDLIFFSLLQEATRNQDSSDVLLLSLSYLYCTQIIPPFVWQKLQETICTLLQNLERKEQPFHWAYLAVSQMDRVIKILKSWQSEAATFYEIDQLRGIVARQISKAKVASSGMTGFPGELPDHYSDCKWDHQFFDDFSVMVPPDPALSKFEPDLSTLVAERRSGNQSSRKRISDYIDKSWKINVTLVDVDWEAGMAYENCNDDSYMGFDPFDIVQAVTLRKGVSNGELSVMKHIQEFFKKISRCISLLQGRLTVEILLGDMTDALERARYGLLDRPEENGSVTSKDWPCQYHIIHMSNIPDYVGGSLTSFLYAAPVLKQGVAGSGLTSCVLRNPPQWKSHHHFNAEHLLMHDPSLIQKHFSVTLANPPPRDPFPMPFDFPMWSYLRWERCQSKEYPLEQLMTRSGLSSWLFAHFLKICLPFPRPQAGWTLVYAPLNMTVFMRLLIRMAEVGYPAHWLSGVVRSLAAGEITTTARAPRKYVMTPAALDKVHPSRTINVKPWIAEFTTLATIWRGLLPFGLVAPSKLLPAPETIAEYSITFPPIISPDLSYPHFMMVFWNNRKYDEPPKNLRPILLDDEKGDTTTSAQKIRSDGVKVLTTFSWVTKTSTATFWLSSNVIDSMLKEDWKVYIWRVDSWVRLTSGLSLQTVISRKQSWNEWMAPTT
ncbi:hypothetical protein F5B20DRAFT_555437 [Whalleya microplaca]|nr:hypothetical protein F5B20DRAFT_555437 [Whalleya microplaca]